VLKLGALEGPGTKGSGPPGPLSDPSFIGWKVWAVNWQADPFYFHPEGHRCSPTVNSIRAGRKKGAGGEFERGTRPSRMILVSAAGLRQGKAEPVAWCP